MGIPAGPGVGASGQPPAGDQANAVVTGAFSAIGPSLPFAFYGSFNVAIWGDVATALTTTANSANFSVASAAGLSVGDPINSAQVPLGSTIKALAGTNGTIAFPPNKTVADITVTGADADATFGNGTWVGSVQLERSFNGGHKWIVCGIGGAGQQAIYSAGADVSFVASEPERGVLYRLNCTAFTAGININYRLSASGLAAMAWGVPPG